MNYKIELIELDALEIPSTVDKDLDISPGPMEALITSMEKTLLKKILGRRYKKESSNVRFF